MEYLTQPPKKGTEFKLKLELHAIFDPRSSILDPRSSAICKEAQGEADCIRLIEGCHDAVYRAFLTAVARGRTNWYTGAALLLEYQSDNKIPSVDLL
jgi:hypothetical protein